MVFFYFNRLIRVCLIYFLITVFIGTKMTGGKTVSVFFWLLLFSKLRNILMDIKILHIDSNNPILMRQLQELGFENHEDFTSSKEQIEAKIESYHGCYSKPLQN
jgi:hypothetical protein